MLLHEIKPNIKYSMLLSHNKKNIAGFRNRSSTCNLQELNVLYPNIVSIIEKAPQAGKLSVFSYLFLQPIQGTIHHSLQLSLNFTFILMPYIILAYVYVLNSKRHVTCNKVCKYFVWWHYVCKILQWVWVRLWTEFSLCPRSDYYYIFCLHYNAVKTSIFFCFILFLCTTLPCVTIIGFFLN